MKTLTKEYKVYSFSELSAEAKEKVKHWYFAECNNFEKDGYSYFYEISDSDLSEICDDNNYTFLADGNLFCE